MQDERYAKYIGKLAIVPLTFGRHVPIIADRVRMKLLFSLVLPPFQNIVRPRFPRSNFDHKFNQRDQLWRDKKLYN